MAPKSSAQGSNTQGNAPLPSTKVDIPKPAAAAPHSQPTERLPLLHHRRFRRTRTDDGLNTTHSHSAFYYIIIFLAVLSVILSIAAYFAQSPSSKIPAPPENYTFVDSRESCSDLTPMSSSEYLVRQEMFMNELQSHDATAFVAEPGSSMKYYTGLDWSGSETPFLMVIRVVEDETGKIHPQTTLVSPASDANAARENIANADLSKFVDVIEWQDTQAPYSSVIDIIGESQTTVFFDESLRYFIVDGIVNAANSRSINFNYATNFLQVPPCL